MYGTPFRSGRGPLSIDDVAADQYANEYLSMQIVAMDKNQGAAKAISPRLPSH
jgi:hypothetical protein